MNAAIEWDRDTWLVANQRYLTAALHDLRRHLEIWARAQGVEGTEAGPPRGAADEVVFPDTVPPPMVKHVAQTFGLSSFEQDVLTLCAGVELDGEFARYFGSLLSEGQSAPTFGLALAALPAPHWSAVAPEGALRQWQLVEIGPGSSLVVSPLRIDERVLHHLTGLDSVDERLRGLFEPLEQIDTLALSHQRIVQAINKAWQAQGDSPVPVQLHGNDTAARLGIAARALRQQGVTPRIAALAAMPSTVADIESTVRLWNRELLMSGRALVLDLGWDTSLEPARELVVTTVARNYLGPLVLVGHRRHAFADINPVTYEVTKPTTEEQRFAWYQGLRQRGVLSHGAMETSTDSGDGCVPEAEQLVSRIVNHFDLSLGAIGTVTASLPRATVVDAASDRSRGLDEDLWERCRAQARPRLDDLAKRVARVSRWHDLVLPDDRMRTLELIVANMRARTTVYESWGFSKGARHGGLITLFCGPSGTGKTLAGEVIAGELGLDLYRVDLAATVSKYIGETEKNLSRIFDAADEGGVVLLFDEADALFGKRSEVKDSHDRYANLEVSYLLQRLETYRGLAVLTSNMREAIDSAFARRIAYILEFPFPDFEQRLRIWRGVFPADMPAGEIRMEELARLSCTGGVIRNIALNAAFLAADDGTPVSMPHLLAATRSEYAKLQLPVPEAEVRKWNIDHG